MIIFFYMALNTSQSNFTHFLNLHKNPVMQDLKKRCYIIKVIMHLSFMHQGILSHCKHSTKAENKQKDHGDNKPNGTKRMHRKSLSPRTYISLPNLKF